MLAEEEAAVPAKKTSPKAGAKKSAAKPAGPGAIAAATAAAATISAVRESSSKNDGGEPQEIESFSATGIDNALDLAEVITATVCAAATVSSPMAENASNKSVGPTSSREVGVLSMTLEDIKIWGRGR